MSGGLLHLLTIEQGPMFAAIAISTIGSAYTNESIVLNLDSMVNNLSRTTDLMLPEYILVDMNNQPIGHSAEYIMQNYRLVFTMGEREDKYIPLQILDYLEKASITPRNKLKIPINFNYFINYNDGFPMVALAACSICVNIEHMRSGERLNNASIICKGKYLSITSVTERRNIASNLIKYKSREIYTLHLESTTPEKIFNIYGNGLLGGFVLRINNTTTAIGNTIENTIENITGIEFLINGHTRHNFIEDLIDTQCQRLSRNSIYIPMNLDSNLRSEINSNALNLSRIDNFQIKITTNLHSGFTITAYAIQPNLYNIMSGTMKSAFIFYLSLTVPENPIDRRGVVGRVPMVARPIPHSQQQQTVVQWVVGKIDFVIPIDIKCSIMYEPIDISQGVCKCNRCDNIFGYNAFKIWVTEQSRSCPICRNTNIENKYYTVSGYPNVVVSVHIPAIITANANYNYVDQNGNIHVEDITGTEPVIIPNTQNRNNRKRTHNKCNIL